MAVVPIKEKDRTVKKEMARLNKIYADLDGKRKQAAEGLIQEAAYMRATLGELRNLIDTAGPIDEMQQGDYSIIRKHPAVEVYNTMIQRYLTACKQLTDMLPKDVPKPDEDDGFEKFVAERDD